jgi:hypothetical protein
MYPTRQTTKHVSIPARTVGIIDPCTEKKFIDLNPSEQGPLGILQDILM